MRRSVLSLLCFLCLLSPQEALAACDYVKVRASTLNIRPDPNTNRSPVGSVSQGTCLKVLQKTTTGQDVQGDKTWYKIKHNGVTGWISGYWVDCSNCGTPPPECTEGKTKVCYSGPAGTAGKGECKEGKKTCSGGKWGACSGEVTPQAEACNNNKDDDCDGSTDEGCTPTECTSGQTQACYTGPPKTRGKGECKEGQQSCSGGKWGPCNGQVLPRPQDTCGNNKDDDCDGSTDENCSTTQCQPEGKTRPCYTGPANTNGVGICKGGTQTCTGGTWSACQGEVTPLAKETCSNNADDNCNGKTDEGCSSTGDCVDNDQDGYGIGKDCQGEKDCDDSDKTVHPGRAEVCSNGKDDDCKDGDQPCMELGEPCAKPEDCRSKICVRINEENRCSVRCNAAQPCPEGFQCINNQACWKTAAKNDTCKIDGDCKKGEVCQKGKCQPAKGCGCASQGSSSGEGATLLWLVALFSLFWRRLRLSPSRRRQDS